MGSIRVKFSIELIPGDKNEFRYCVKFNDACNEWSMKYFDSIESVVKDIEDKVTSYIATQAA